MNPNDKFKMHAFMHANGDNGDEAALSGLGAGYAQKLDLARMINAFICRLQRWTPTSRSTTNLCPRCAMSRTCLRGTISSCSRSRAGGAQLCSSRQHPTGRARWTFGTNGLEIPRDPPHSEPSSGTAAAPSGLSASKVVSKNQQDEEAHVGGRRRPLGM